MSVIEEELSDDNEVQQLLFSIVIYNYHSNILQKCLDAIFRHHHFTKYEVIICDDATADGSWEIANEYMSRHPNLITLTRNQIALGASANAGKGLQMAKGKYYVELTRDRKFNPEYIQEVIAQLESDPLIMHSYIGKTKDFRPQGGIYKPSPELKRSENPLVSICVYNYNYGRFLHQCLESVAEQTYSNIEICFSDNASTDDSWQIALDFSRRYQNCMSLTRNRINYGASSNLRNCLLNNQGKYMLMLCSDDALRPDFIERCVKLLERYQDAAFAMVHRDIIDDDNNLSSEPPFYDKTCWIPGEEQAAVYMMAAVNPSVSQILYNREKIHGKGMPGSLNDRWFGARLMDFNICSENSIIFIHDPLLLNRVHASSDGASIDANLMQCVGQYVLLHQFAEIASHSGLDKAASRLNNALVKVGGLCLRYCVRFLLQNDEATALRYFHLAQAIFPEVEANTTFRDLQRYWHPSTGNDKSKQEILITLGNQLNFQSRSVSYPPPPGSIAC